MSARVEDVAACPHCGAEKGQPCVRPRQMRQSYHRKRVGVFADVMSAYMVSTFDARELPEMIDVGGEMIAGPFCRHCGNPLSMHGPGAHCPHRALHPVFPPPSCGCHMLDPNDGRPDDENRRRITTDWSSGKPVRREESAV